MCYKKKFGSHGKEEELQNTYSSTPMVNILVLPSSLFVKFNTYVKYISYIMYT